jgi:hypothetical protein
MAHRRKSESEDPVDILYELAIEPLAGWWLKLSSHPFFWTALCTAVTVPEAIRQPSLNALLVGPVYGGFVDGFRYLARQSRLNRRGKNPLEQIMEKEHVDDIIEQIREEGYRGTPTVVSAVAQQEGTAPFEGKEGYFTLVELEFDNGTKQLLHKFVNRPTAWKAEEICQWMQEQGMNFVPKLYTPRNKSPIVHGNINSGIVFDFLGGVSLEEQLNEGYPRLEVREFSSEVVENIFEKLWQFYAADVPSLFRRNYGHLEHLVCESHNAPDIELSSFQFHRKILDWLPAGLATALDTVFTEHIPRCQFPIHGDVHQGNILGNGDYILDWDNVEFGTPYHDFMHFAILTDFTRDPGFEATRSSFVEKMNDLQISRGTDCLSRPALLLTEVEIYMGLLHRFYTTLENDLLLPEFTENVGRSCRYLLGELERSIGEFSSTVQNSQLQRAIMMYFNHRCTDLEDIPFDVRASVAYAHTVNHAYRRPDKALRSVANFASHQLKVEKVIAADENTRSLMILNSFILSVGVAAGYLGVSAIEDPIEFQRQLSYANAVSWVPVGAIMGSLGMYYKHTIQNTLNKCGKAINQGVQYCKGVVKKSE